MPVPDHETEAFPSLDQFLCFSVYSTGHAFNRLYKPLLDPLGLTYPQYLVMVVLWESAGDITVGELGRRLALESSTLTPLLKRLEVAGRVERHRDAQDERRVRIRLTPAGRALKDKALEVPACVYEATGLSVERLIALQRDLETLRKSLLAREAAPAPA
ncbi:MarR family transcriptional regulator (plasmid) [Paroceanicella profunda]|uniref:MarR family transcriptional regulator n=1 Tax=Paroceanicella profunda TaxID=2579971 RepID=A0A5B8FY96_9RHOB|nr:MarR family transcriptional regulator [Paroceanicella profunda]QDL93886.1 MarR family transcriptional regulator [Paroceanicella profunda]